MATVTLTGTVSNDVFHTVQMGYPDLTEFFIDGGHGDDVIRTGNGSSTVYGGKGMDEIHTGAGDDAIHSGNHDDYVHAGRGDDYVSAGAGNDIVYAGKGSDTVLGGSGDDTIYGVKGYNLLDGGTGNDTIDTGVHTSTVLGGEGDDLIKANLIKGGDHTLTGGEGADTFEFNFQSAKKASNLTITDFELGVDTFSVAGVLADDYAIDLSTVTEVNGNAVLSLGSKDSITFEGVTADELITYYDDMMV